MKFKAFHENRTMQRSATNCSYEEMSKKNVNHKNYFFWDKVDSPDIFHSLKGVGRMDYANSIFAYPYNFHISLC